MAKSLHPYREARLTNCMITVGSILILLLSILAFIITMPVSLA